MTLTLYLALKIISDEKKRALPQYIINYFDLFPYSGFTDNENGHPICLLGGSIEEAGDEIEVLRRIWRICESVKSYILPNPFDNENDSDFFRSLVVSSGNKLKIRIIARTCPAGLGPPDLARRTWPAGLGPPDLYMDTCPDVSRLKYLHFFEKLL